MATFKLCHSSVHLWSTRLTGNTYEVRGVSLALCQLIENPQLPPLFLSHYPPHHHTLLCYITLFSSGSKGKIRSQSFYVKELPKESFIDLKCKNICKNIYENFQYKYKIIQTDRNSFAMCSYFHFEYWHTFMIRQEAVWLGGDETNGRGEQTYLFAYSHINFAVLNFDLQKRKRQIKMTEDIRKDMSGSLSGLYLVTR